MREIILPQDVRYFKKYFEILSRIPGPSDANSWICKETKIEIGNPIKLQYNYQIQWAVPFNLNGRTFYFILSEIGIPELAKELTNQLAN